MGKIRKEDLISLYRIEECFRHFYKFRFLKDIDIHLLILSFGDKPDLINNIKTRIYFCFFIHMPINLLLTID